MSHPPSKCIFFFSADDASGLESLAPLSGKNAEKGKCKMQIRLNAIIFLLQFFTSASCADAEETDYMWTREKKKLWRLKGGREEGKISRNRKSSREGDVTVSAAAAAAAVVATCGFSFPGKSTHERVEGEERAFGAPSSPKSGRSFLPFACSSSPPQQRGQKKNNCHDFPVKNGALL